MFSCPSQSQATSSVRHWRLEPMAPSRTTTRWRASWRNGGRTIRRGFLSSVHPDGLLDQIARASSLRASFIDKTSCNSHLALGLGMLIEASEKESAPHVSDDLELIVSAKPRVLVVEDDLDSYLALSKILKHVGYDTLSAASLTSAYELLREAPLF